MARKHFTIVAYLAFCMSCLQHPIASAADAVLLGKDDLTKGIPGAAKLTVSEIKKFLDFPANHEVLKVKLPDGLSAGVDAIYIPADNPLTRAKIELGRQLYFDKRLSGDNSVSCGD